MIDYGFPLEDYANEKGECVNLAANYLNNGVLSLLLGAGTSRGFGLPNWKDLVVNCHSTLFPSTSYKKKYENHELKKLADAIKSKAGSNYIELVKEKLYEGVKFDFSLTKKDLLIALTSLIVGRSRGNVRNIITYNFDSVLEWYLSINGLSVNVTTADKLLYSSVDVDIIHLHGYLPHDKKVGYSTSDLVFTKKEFEDRQIQSSYWKDLMNEFYKRNIFLSVGLSPGSLLDDVCPYLRNMNSWYEKEKISRNQPYGIAFMTPSTEADEVVDELIETGIIPCILSVGDMPTEIFRIAQKALEKRL